MPSTTRQRSIPVIDEETVRRLLPPASAVGALRDAIASGLAATDPARRTVFEAPTGQGSFLLMPFASPEWLGIKVLSALPAPTSSRPAITGTYFVIDPELATLSAVIDGTALTSVRTPAVTAVALERLAHPAAERVVVIGTGTQAREHLRTFLELGRFSEYTVVGRDAVKAAELADEFAGSARPVRAGTPADIARADVIVCCTAAQDPLFDSDVVKPTAVVAAVGSYRLSARELDERLLARSTVFVESIETALTEAGDVHQALLSGSIAVDDLRTLDQLGATDIDYDRPRVFKSCGMSWEDLAVATELLDRWRDEPPAE